MDRKRAKLLQVEVDPFSGFLAGIFYHLDYCDIEILSIEKASCDKIGKSHSKKLIITDQLSFFQLVVNNEEGTHEFQEVVIVGDNFDQCRLGGVDHIAVSMVSIR